MPVLYFLCLTQLWFVYPLGFFFRTGYMFRQLPSSLGEVLHRMAACDVLFNL